MLRSNTKNYEETIVDISSADVAPVPKERIGFGHGQPR